MPFESRPTAQANREEADRWLEKAIALEKEGKSTRMVDMALDRACQFENAWYELRNKQQ